MPMVLWSSAMAVVLFLHEARWGSMVNVVWSGIAVTLAFGAYLGWQRRVAAVFVAPVISWMFAWFPLIVAAIIRDGFFRGIIAGVFWITVGWLMIAFLEFVGLIFSSMLVRRLRGGPRNEGPDVVIFGPDRS